MKTLSQDAMSTVNTPAVKTKPQGFSPLAPLHVLGGRGGRRPGWGPSLAFTLVELLVVIAITIIMFALLLRPLVESLRLTQSAQTQAAAQDAARITMERISRELASAVFVYDNASHPFVSAAAVGGIPAGARVDHFTNFLNLGITTNDGKIVVEHAYNCKLDIVPARHSNSVLNLKDPTNGDEPIQPKSSANGSATLSSTGLLFPLAPDSTITRNFVGLKDPTKPYTNSNEGLLAAAGASDNTYILYSAQVTPYRTDKGTNADGTTINEKLFAPMHDSTGKVVNKPELDDPDFFRYVNLNGATDVNWLDVAHAVYPTQNNSPVPDGSPTQHNQRVDEWYKIAKPVITAPDIDLLQLPHNPDGSVAYDAGTAGATVCTSATTCPAVAHSGVAYDALKGTAYPVVNTTVAFRPAVVEGDAAPATTTDYTSLGIPANAADNGGLPYIPTFYTAANQSWAYPYNITLYPLYGVSPQPDTSKPYYTTDLDTSGATGDIIEYGHTSSADATGTPVYDVTTNTLYPAYTGHNYVPLSVKPDTGTVSFDTPAYPDSPPTYNRFFKVVTTDLNGTTQGTIPNYVPEKWHLDLTKLPNSPLPPNDTTALTGQQVVNARIVPGSVRVYGPDATPGPNLGSRVLYSQVSPGTPLGFNQYRVDYLNSQIYFFGDDSNRLPEVLANNSTPGVNVQIAFDYQANLAPSDSTQPISAANPANPMLVKVDYQTRDLMDVSIGVRIYDNGQSRSIVIPATNRVQIGNSNR